MPNTFDLLVFNTPVMGKNVQVETTFNAAAGGNACQGIVKLAQKFLLKLFKIAGSQIYRPNDGNDFIRALRTGQIRTVLDAFVAFSTATAAIGREFAREVVEGQTDDEKFSSARLVNVLLSPGSLSLEFEMRSVAGTSAKFIAPLPVISRDE